MSPRLDLLSYWYSAKDSKFGISLLTNNVDRLQSRLLAEKKKQADPQLDSIYLAASPYLPDEEIWLVKRTERKNGSDSTGDTGKPTGNDEGTEIPDV